MYKLLKDKQRLKPQLIEGPPKVVWSGVGLGVGCQHIHQYILGTSLMAWLKWLGMFMMQC
jgi:hypothetical protein